MFNKKPEEQDGNAMTSASNTPSSAPSNTASSASASGSAATVLAEGCSFEGKAEVSGTLRVEGYVEGEITASDNIVVGKSGKMEATVKTRRAVLSGRFNGSIHAEDCVEMQSGSVVEAEIHARNMVMEDGVQFEGKCKIGK